MVSITRGPSSEEVVWTSAEILHVEYRFVFTFFLHVSNWNRHPAQEDTLELESLKNSTHFTSCNILDGRFKVGLKTFVLVACAASWLLTRLRSIRCPESDYADHEPGGFRLVAELLFFESSVNHAVG